MVSKVILQTFDDWYAAYEFYCSKEDIEVIAKEKWHDQSLFDTVKLTYSHSVYNVTSQTYRSNTFQYVDKQNKTRHIKVVSGVVTDWYTLVLNDNVRIFDRPVSWFSHDLVTGDNIEYYSEVLGESCSKYDINTNQQLGTVFTVFSDESLLKSIKDQLQDFPYLDNIFSYGEKPYGIVVEFTYTMTHRSGVVDVTRT